MQRIDAATRLEIGDDLRLSDNGGVDTVPTAHADDHGQCRTRPASPMHGNVTVDSARRSPAGPARQPARTMSGQMLTFNVMSDNSDFGNSVLAHAGRPTVDSGTGTSVFTTADGGAHGRRRHQRLRGYFGFAAVIDIVVGALDDDLGRPAPTTDAITSDDGAINVHGLGRPSHRDLLMKRGRSMPWSPANPGSIFAVAPASSTHDCGLTYTLAADAVRCRHG